MTNCYYTHIAAGSAQEASIFSNQYTWTILDVVRKAGPRGLTAKDVHKKVEREMGTSVSASMVYSLLKRLYELEWIHRRYDAESEAQRHTIGVIWGGMFVDSEFDKAVTSKTLQYAEKRLYPALFEYITKSMEVLKEDSATRKWLPAPGDSESCKRCRISHEAEEFFSSLLDTVRSEFLDSDQFREFLEKNNFALPKEE